MAQCGDFSTDLYLVVDSAFFLAFPSQKFVMMSLEQTTENPFLLRFKRRHSQLFSDLGHDLLLGNIRAFRHNLFADYDSGSAGKIRFSPFVCFIFCLGFGCRFNVNEVRCAQPERHLLEMSSRLAIGFIQKKTNF